jgi:simple sugar transport system substrate-binding protein
VNIVQLEGTTGADPALERSSGFAKAIAANPNLHVIASQSGDFTRSGGKQVMEAFLKANPKIDMVFAQNDDMGLGAIEAIEAAGLKPGQDIKIVAVDATHDGMQALADGKFNFLVECNPLLGPQLMDLAKKVAAGEPVPPRVVTPDQTFDQVTGPPIPGRHRLLPEGSSDDHTASGALGRPGGPDAGHHHRLPRREGARRRRLPLAARRSACVDGGERRR